MALQRDKTYIASHSGVYAGNLMRNTIPACEAALRMGADILEVDVARSADGTLFLFHEGYEAALLHSERAIGDMTAADIHGMRYVNLFGNSMDQTPDTLDDFLAHFKGRCTINLDRCWTKLPEAVEAVRRHGMADQILFKAEAKTPYLAAMSELAGDIPFMVIAREPADLETARRYALRLTAAELLFKTPGDPLVQPETMDRLHGEGLLLWVNAIVYNYRAVLSGGLTDDLSVVEGPAAGWGRLIDMGFDILQTDFPDTLSRYLTERTADQTERMAAG